MALPVLRCDRCNEQYVPALNGERVCGRCERQMRANAERRRDRTSEYWLEWNARRSERGG